MCRPFSTQPFDQIRQRVKPIQPDTNGTASGMKLGKLALRRQTKALIEGLAYELLHFFDRRIYNGRALISASHKYVLYDWGRFREQLFDLDTDPGEMTTLSRSLRHADLLQAMRDKLAEQLVAFDDPFGTRSIAGVGYSPVPKGSYRLV